MGDHQRHDSLDAAAPANREGVVQRIMFRRLNRRSDGKQELLSGETLLEVVRKLEETGLPVPGQQGDRDKASAGMLLDGDSVSIGATESTQCYMGENRAIENRATVNLTLMKWDGRPQCVLIIEKSGDRVGLSRFQTGESRRLSHETVRILERIVRHCHFQLKLDVIVEGRVQRELPTCTFLSTCDEDPELFHEPRTAMPRTQSETTDQIAMSLRKVDFCIAIGHDGAVVSCASLFDKAVPPVLPIALHHAGIMTRVRQEEAEQMLSTVVNQEFHLGMRVRLRCKLYSFKTGESQVIHALNDVVMDRGPSPFLTSVECYCNNRLITLVQGDGLIIATPTGSTAYSQAAGGAMVHPDVPCVLFTPLNPHSLSFRPLVLPNSVTLRLQLTPNARSVAWVCFDGRNRQPLAQGDRLEVTVAHWPVPIIQGAKEDWVDGCNAFLSSKVRDFVARFKLRPAL